MFLFILFLYFEFPSKFWYTLLTSSDRGIKPIITCFTPSSDSDKNEKNNLVEYFSTRWRWYHSRMILTSFAHFCFARKKPIFEKKEKEASSRRGSIQDNLGINRHTRDGLVVDCFFVLSFILNRNKQNTNNNNKKKETKTTAKGGEVSGYSRKFSTCFSFFSNLGEI